MATILILESRVPCKSAGMEKILTLKIGFLSNLVGNEQTLLPKSWPWQRGRLCLDSTARLRRSAVRGVLTPVMSGWVFETLAVKLETDSFHSEGPTTILNFGYRYQGILCKTTPERTTHSVCIATYKKKGRQTDRQTDRQTARQTDRQTCGHAEGRQASSPSFINCRSKKVFVLLQYHNASQQPGHRQALSRAPCFHRRRNI